MEQEVIKRSEGTIDEVLQLVCFTFADEQYAVDIRNAHEVILVPRITRVPQVPDFTLGVINVRGQIVPVFDLRRKFGLLEKEFDEQTKILIAEVNGGQISFIVDKMLDNIKLDASMIDPSPHVKMKIERECIQGIGQLEGRMIIILDLHKLSESIDRAIKECSPRD